jgi:hypothetical protein
MKGAGTRNAASSPSIKPGVLRAKLLPGTTTLERRCRFAAGQIGALLPVPRKKPQVKGVSTRRGGRSQPVHARFPRQNLHLQWLEACLDNVNGAIGAGPVNFLDGYCSFGALPYRPGGLRRSLIAV